MSFLSIRIQKLITFVILTVSIIACSEDPDSTLSKSVDVDAPFIVSTSPESGATKVGTDVVIEVRFNENIEVVQPDNIEIYPYQNGGSDLNNAILLSESNPFEFDPVTNTVGIHAQSGQYQAAKIYQVTVLNIRDTSGNVMALPCTWKFAMDGTGAPTNVEGGNGLCGKTVPLIEVPSTPRNVRALPGNQSVTLKWDAPITGEPDYYKIAVQVDNQIALTPLDSHFTGNDLTFADSTPSVGLAHIYSVIAVNTVGDSTAALSDIVVPMTATQFLQPYEILNSSNPGEFSAFGISVSMTNDGLSLAIGEAGVLTATYIKIGTVQLYTRTSIDSVWNVGPLLTLNAPGTSRQFGSKVKFSPDGAVLAVAEIHAGSGTAVDTGKVHLFGRSGTSWGNIPLLGPEIVSGIPESDDLFGFALAFSPDSEILAIGAPFIDYGYLFDSGGSVQLFKKSSASWLDTPITAGPTLVSNLRFHNNRFGKEVVFSRDGKTIAVGEENGLLTERSTRIGKVHIFNKLQDDWLNQPAIGPVLISQDPNGSFGFSLDFSPDSKTLAVGEYFGNMPDRILTGVGNVQLFNRVGDTWDAVPAYGQIITSKSPAEYNAFGAEVRFSPEGSKLFVGESNGDPEGYNVDVGLIEVINRTDVDWLEVPSHGITLISDLPTTGKFFGGVFEISHDGSTVIVSDILDDYNGLRQAGAVKLIDVSQIY